MSAGDPDRLTYDRRPAGREDFGKYAVKANERVGAMDGIVLPRDVEATDA
ncbi:hypothetical protein ACWDX6_23140 [Streptomyces sp. NPDC003027]